MEAEEALVEEKCCEVYVDGANNAKGVGMGTVIFNKIEQSVRITFLMTNNVA